MQPTHKIIFFTSVAFLVAAVAFFCIGWYTNPDHDEAAELTSQEQERLSLMNKLLEDKLAMFDIKDDYDKVNLDNIRNNMLEISKEPHVAGLPRDQELVDWVKQEWENQGMDEVQVSTYNLLLSYPDADKPNIISIYNDDQTGPVFVSSPREDIEDLPDTFINAFLAFSKPGTAEGEVVYVNYGRTEDFEMLKEPDYETSVAGKICMVRYGKLGRGSKLRNGEYYGCSGVIIFSDPEDVAGEGTDPDQLYPNTQFLPDTGIQRGSINPISGDPVTPNWPSLDKAYRLAEEDIDVPSIPAQPIGYRDATEIFKVMDGKTPPESGWVGGIEGVQYTLGGSFKASCGTNCRVRLESHNKLETTENSNVIGIIRGDIEPDRYVMFGNHRDAWGYGAIDAATGGSQMMEVTRILADKVKSEGWRPRRSLVFVSWGAEEHGLVGSREFNEDFLVKLMERAVAYVNVDICSCGPILRASASPSIKDQLLQTIKNVPNPWDPSETYYDEWKRWHEEGGYSSDPDVRLIPAGSDHASFIFYSGIPVIDISFRPDTNLYPTAANSLYPTYHTGFETFQLVDEIVDPGFLIHGTCSKMSLYLSRKGTLGDSLFLDFRPIYYYDLMQENLDLFDSEGVTAKLTELNVDVTSLKEQVANFQDTVKLWEGEAAKLNVTQDPIVARMLNDQMSKLDRLFILTQGLPNRAVYRHGIITPSLYQNYPTAAFPGVTDLLYDIDNISTADREERVVLLKRHISDLMITVKAASDYLKEFHKIA